MVNRTDRLAFAGLLTLALGACGGEQRPQREPQANAAEAAEAAAAPAALPTDAAGFVAALGASDLYEIRSSALARSKAASADLRSFAQRLEREHAGSSAQLKAAAAAAGITAEPALDPDKQAMIAALEGASGPAFDALYLDQQRLAHQTTLMLLQNYAGSGDNAALKAHADKARAMVEVHADLLNYMRK